jgi:hypothetical protein
MQGRFGEGGRAVCHGKREGGGLGGEHKRWPRWPRPRRVPRSPARLVGGQLGLLRDDGGVQVAECVAGLLHQAHRLFQEDVAVGTLPLGVVVGEQLAWGDEGQRCRRAGDGAPSIGRAGVIRRRTRARAPPLRASIAMHCQLACREAGALCAGQPRGGAGCAATPGGGRERKGCGKRGGMLHGAELFGAHRCPGGRARQGLRPSRCAAARRLMRWGARWEQ